MKNKIDWSKLIIDILKVVAGAIFGASAATVSGCAFVPVF